MRFIKSTTAAVAVLLAAAALPAKANLIVNGGFDDLGGQSLQSTNWGYFSNIPGWEGMDHIEVQRDGFLADAVNGGYYAELQAHPSQGFPFQLMSDDFATVAGDVYELTFYAQKRRNGDGAFDVMIDGAMQTISDHVRGAWTEYSLLFVADGTSAVSFLSRQGGGDTVGHFLDAVSVTRVPEPGVLTLLGLALAGLGFAQRRQR